MKITYNLYSILYQHIYLELLLCIYDIFNNEINYSYTKFIIHNVINNIYDYICCRYAVVQSDGIALKEKLLDFKSTVGS